MGDAAYYKSLLQIYKHVCFSTFSAVQLVSQNQAACKRQEILCQLRTRRQGVCTLSSTFAAKVLWIGFKAMQHVLQEVRKTASRSETE